MLTQKQLLTQHSYDVITTSQSLIVVLAKSITSYNTNLLIWIAKQKQESLPVPDIIESTSRKIGANMSTLTEICYSYQPQENEPLNLETLVRQLETQMREVNQVAEIEAQPPGESGHSVGYAPELGHLFEFIQKRRL